MSKQTLRLIAEKRLAMKSKQSKTLEAMMPVIGQLYGIPGGRELSDQFNGMVAAWYEMIDETLNDVQVSLENESRIGNENSAG